MDLTTRTYTSVAINETREKITRNLAEIRDGIFYESHDGYYRLVQVVRVSINLLSNHYVKSVIWPDFN